MQVHEGPPPPRTESEAPTWDGVPATYSLELNFAQEAVRDKARQFAMNVLRPAAKEWRTRKDHPPIEILQEAARQQFYSLKDLVFFLQDPTNQTFGLINKEMAYGDAGLTLAIYGTTLAVAALTASGTGEQINTWAPMCFGDVQSPRVAAFCNTEPDAGSDLSQKKARAVKDGDDYVLNGEFIFITNGGLPDAVHVVNVVVDPDPQLGTRGQALFVIPPGTAGVKPGAEPEKIGIQASHTAGVILNNVRLPKEYLLGGEENLQEKIARAREGQSSRSQGAMATFEASRPIVGAQALGIAEAAYDYAVQYAKGREVFGSHVAEKQLGGARLAEMRMKIDAARLMVFRALWMARNGGYHLGEGSMAKLLASEVAIEVTKEAMDTLGGHGYVKDHPVAEWHCDALIYNKFEGTRDILMLDVASRIAGTRIR